MNGRSRVWVASMFLITLKFQINPDFQIHKKVQNDANYIFKLKACVTHP